jgi:hypothetical protein
VTAGMSAPAPMTPPEAPGAVASQLSGESPSQLSAATQSQVSGAPGLAATAFTAAGSARGRVCGVPHDVNLV